MEVIIAAAVTGSFALLAILVEKGRRENKADHGVVATLLKEVIVDIEEIDTDIKVLEAKIDTHLIDHNNNIGTKKKK